MLRSMISKGSINYAHRGYFRGLLSCTLMLMGQLLTSFNSL